MNPEDVFAPTVEKIKKQSKAAEFKESVIGILDRVFKDRYTVQGTSYLEVYIHYPEIEITNSLGMKRTLNDMVVHFALDREKLREGLSGTKLSYYEDELRSGYKHSHLRQVNALINNEPHTGQIMEISSFCLGSSELAVLQSELFMDMDLNKLEVYMFFIEHYLAWESLEGGPYFRMEKIGQERTPSSRLQNRYQMSYDHINRSIKYVLDNVKDLPVKLVDRGNTKSIEVDASNRRLYALLDDCMDIKAYNKKGTIEWITVLPGSQGTTVDRFNQLIAGRTWKVGSLEIPIRILEKPGSVVNREGVIVEDVSNLYEYRYPNELYERVLNGLKDKLNNYIIIDDRD